MLVNTFLDSARQCVARLPIVKSLNTPAHRPRLRRSAAPVALALLSACTVSDHAHDTPTVPEIQPGVLQGYLAQADLPDSLALLPPPPASNSESFAADQAIAKQSTHWHATQRWALASSDADLSFPHAASTFSCALGAPVSQQQTPRLYLLLRRTLTDAGLATYRAKNQYQRPRPFMVNHLPTCSPGDEPELRKDGSYPSGHNAVGWAWALILTQIAPDRTNAILARGLAFGQNRVICNVHWQSDADNGRLIGAAAVARLNADPTFQSDLSIARDEIASARAKGEAPTRDCGAEANALAAK